MKRILFAILVVVFCAGLLCGCSSTKSIDKEFPMFIDTIDKPDSGTGEVIIGKLYIKGSWAVDQDDEGRAVFTGSLGTVDMEDWGKPYHHPKQEVSVSFVRREDCWAGEIPYISTDGASKAMLVFTDEKHSVWVFESEDRVTYAPADHIDEVLEICSKLGIEQK